MAYGEGFCDGSQYAEFIEGYALNDDDDFNNDEAPPSPPLPALKGVVAKGNCNARECCCCCCCRCRILLADVVSEFVNAENAIMLLQLLLPLLPPLLLLLLRTLL